MVGSTACLISMLTICWIFGGNRTGVDTKLTNSIFSQSLMIGRGVLGLRLLFERETGVFDKGQVIGKYNDGGTGFGFFGVSN